MRLAVVGLGKMGANMARRLVSAGHEVVGYNRTSDVTDALATEIGLAPAYSVREVVDLLATPRVIWVMVPAGAITETVLYEYLSLLSPGDVLIDGGNSNFHDTIRRAQAIQEKGVHFVDVGTSGGIWGITEGYSLMVGGDKEVVKALTPIFQALAPEAKSGWGRVGPNGAGHYVKMVHNGIEYGMMEAFAEGFEIMKSRREFDLDLYQISQIWRQGSVVRSWLLDLIGEALEEDAELSDLQAWVADSGEGRWTVMEAIDQAVPAPVISLALFRRFSSRQENSYAARLLAAMRNQFGGHAVKKNSGRKPGE